MGREQVDGLPKPDKLLKHLLRSALIPLVGTSIPLVSANLDVIRAGRQARKATRINGLVLAAYAQGPNPASSVVSIIVEDFGLDIRLRRDFQGINDQIRQGGDFGEVSGLDIDLETGLMYPTEYRMLGSTVVIPHPIKRRVGKLPLEPAPYETALSLSFKLPSRQTLSPQSPRPKQYQPRRSSEGGE